MDETYVPGLNQESGRRTIVTPEKNATLSIDANVHHPMANDTGESPVVGFLYSLSRGGDPEWWPLYIGQNKIGKDAQMDICLAEASITGHHANINIKRMRRNGNALAASIVDVGSKNGIILNDEELDFEPHSIKNEDIITFGLNYKCVIILIDPTKYCLSENPEFVTSSTTSKQKFVSETIPGVLPELPNGGSIGNDPFDGFNDSATINISGSGIDLSGGATKIL